MTAPSIITLAERGDEAKIFNFFLEAHADNGFFPVSSQKVIDVIIRACRGECASIGLIKDHKGNIEAASGIMLDRVWYSDVYFLSELLNFVHPNHRKSNHAKALLKFQKDSALHLSNALGYNVPIIPSLVTRKRLEPKMRLFQREFQQVGAIFAYNLQDFAKESDEFFNQRKIEHPKNMNGNHARNATEHKVVAMANGAQ